MEEKLTYPLTLKLEYPVEYGEELISELRLPRPKGKHFRQFNMEEASMSDMMDMLGKLAGQPPSVIDELDFSDLQRGFETMGKLLQPSPATSMKR